jgi:hypothetical protein
MRVDIGLWPQVAVGKCLLFRRCRGISRHQANRLKMTRVTHLRHQRGETDSIPNVS